MNSLLFVMLLCISLSMQESTLVDDGVLELTDETFDAVFSKHSAIMVEFHAQWCAHCKKLAPEYAKAADLLKLQNSDYLLAKIDSTENKKVTDRFAVRGFPTMLFFKGG